MTTPLRCPHCTRVNDHHDRAAGQRPEPGDVAVCWKCGGLALFDLVVGDLVLRLPTADERADLEQSEELAAVRAAIGVAQTPQQALAQLWGTS